MKHHTCVCGNKGSTKMVSRYLLKAGWDTSIQPLANFIVPLLHKAVTTNHHPMLMRNLGPSTSTNTYPYFLQIIIYGNKGLGGTRHENEGIGQASDI